MMQHQTLRQMIFLLLALCNIMRLVDAKELCHICGDPDMIMGKLDGLPVKSLRGLKCSDLQDQAIRGLIPKYLCASLQEIVFEPCDCHYIAYTASAAVMPSSWLATPSPTPSRREVTIVDLPEESGDGDAVPPPRGSPQAASTVPSPAPSDRPSDVPSDVPTLIPSSYPTATYGADEVDNTTEAVSDRPSSVPSDMPSNVPTWSPVIASTEDSIDLETDSEGEALPSDMPSRIPSDMPSWLPSDLPSQAPSDMPSLMPSDVPSMIPSSIPSDYPSLVPVKWD